MRRALLQRVVIVDQWFLAEGRLEIHQTDGRPSPDADG